MSINIFAADEKTMSVHGKIKSVRIKPTKEELYYCYHVLNMKQKDIEKKFNCNHISRLLVKYEIPIKKRKKITTQEVIYKFKTEREDRGEFYDYSEVNYVNRNTKVKIICPLHGEFYQLPFDHCRGYSGCVNCSKIKARKTNLERYGAENPFQSEEIKRKIKQTNLERYGVENPSQSIEIHQKKIQTCLKNYGVEYGPKSDIIKEKIRQTSLERYGVTCAMKLPEIANRSIATRIKNNTYINHTGSKEAREYIKNYIKEKNYELSQCAFSDKKHGLHEWGYYYEGRWILYDLVVFEKGHRGNKNKIIEILEYHGPFHYKHQDVIERGNEKATPWRKSKMTIKESYETDKLKEKFGRSLTPNYTIVWPDKYH